MSEWQPGSENRREISLAEFWAILRRRKLLILLALLVGMAGAVGIVFLQTPQYTSTAQLLFLAQNSGTGSGASSELEPGQLATAIQLIQGSPVTTETAKLLGQVPPSVSVTEIGATSVASISVTSPNAVLASQAANDYAKAYIIVTDGQYFSTQVAAEASIQKQLTAINNSITALTNQAGGTTLSGASNIAERLTGLYTQQAALQQQLNAMQAATSQSSASGQIVQPATVSAKPSSPKKTRDVLVGAAAGLLAGIGLALLVDSRDDRIRTAVDLETASGSLPTIGLIPALSEWRDRKAAFLVTSERSHSPAAEAYRTLRTSVKFMALERPGKILQVTSPAASEGKSTTSANLACAMAESGQRVVLVDCDLRRPRVHEFFHMSNEQGLTSFLLGETPLEDALIMVPGNENLRVLPSGHIPPNPSEMLSSERVGWLFHHLEESADVVILDSSPVLPVTDALVLAARVDGVLLVAAAGITSARSLTQALELLGRVDARVIGTVLNRAPEAASYGYQYSAYNAHVATNGNLPANAQVVTNGNGKLDQEPRHARPQRDTP